jgi:hypothetical protein
LLADPRAAVLGVNLKFPEIFLAKSEMDGLKHLD